MPTAKTPPSYADALDQSRKALAAARLNDPGEHFPYRYDDVSALLAQNPKARPDPEGDPDDDRMLSDYMTQEIVDASSDVVDAEAAWLADLNDTAKREAHTAAQAALVAARAAHRANRRGLAIGGRARRAGE